MKKKVQNSHKLQKVVVFDLDETLGCFVQLGSFCTGLENFLKRKLTDKEFFKIMDTFPNYQRPNIISILNYIKQQKEKGECSKVYIYTNNQGPKSWALQIQRYFQHKLSYPLFDKVIHAFKANGKRIEMNRTSHDKSVGDFLKCTKLHKGTQICFLDDQYHHQMVKNNVFYLQLKRYRYTYNPLQLAKSLSKIDLFGTNKRKAATSYVKKYLIEDNYYHCLTTDIDKRADKLISKKILIELQSFFQQYDSPSQTRRRGDRDRERHTRKQEKIKGKHIFIDEH